MSCSQSQARLVALTAVAWALLALRHLVPSIVLFELEHVGLHVLVLFGLCQLAQGQVGVWRARVEQAVDMHAQRHDLGHLSHHLARSMHAALFVK